jgi:hypothetical protein
MNIKSSGADCPGSGIAIGCGTDRRGIDNEPLQGCPEHLMPALITRNKYWPEFTEKND